MKSRKKCEVKKVCLSCDMIDIHFLNSKAVKTLLNLTIEYFVSPVQLFRLDIHNSRAIDEMAL